MLAALSKPFTKPDPKEQARKWKREMRAQQRVLDRQIRGIKKEEAKLKLDIKKMAKKGSQAAAIRTLAKELVRSQHATAKIMESKATINSVVMQLDHNLAVLKVSGALEKSTEVMQAMNKLVKIPELQETCRNMAMEMERSGLVGEMVEDALAMNEGDELEEETDEEVNRVIMDLTADVMNKADIAPTTALPASETAEAADVEGEMQADANILEMRSRLEAL